MYKRLFGAAVALGMFAAPATAQMINTTDTSTTPMTTHKTMTTMHTSTHRTMTMGHHHMTRAQMKTMKWCKGMSHKRAMRYKSCRNMMSRHMPMTHHHTTVHKKAM